MSSQKNQVIKWIIIKAASHPTAADIDTVIINGQVRKRHGKLVGQDLAQVRVRANQALNRLKEAAEVLPIQGPEGIKQWWTIGERMATKSFAEAYKDGVVL